MHIGTWSQVYIVLLSASVLAAAPAAGQTSYPFVYSLYPAGVQCGAAADINLKGLHNYHGAYRVLVSGKGVSGEVVVPKDGWPAVDAKTGKPPAVNEITLKVTAAPDAPFGTRDLRVVTPRGVSSVGQLAIGSDPESLEKEPNNDLSQAQDVALPATMNGRIQQGEDVDSYRIKVNAGDEVTCAVLCARMQDRIHDLQSHADPMLSIRDSSGRELAANDDYYRADPLLRYRFEKAGDYTVQLRDVSYGGNGYWVYRLTMTTGPYVTAMLPLAAGPGEKSQVSIAGFGLAGSAAAALEIPADLAAGEHRIPLRLPTGNTNPVPVIVTDLARVDHDAARTTPVGQSVAIPGAISGRIATAGETHRYRFRAAKGELIALRVYGRAVDSQLDPVLAILNSTGGEIAASDDSPGSLDPRLDWTSPSDGEFMIQISDLHRKGGQEYIYLLMAQRGAPDFGLRSDDDKMNLGPGSSGAWYIHVDRRFGFNGEIKIEAAGLPAGVTAAPLTIPPNVNQGCLILSCAAGAKVDAAIVEVIGTAGVAGPDGKQAVITRRAVPQSEIYLPGGGRGLYAVETQTVAITEAPDIVIELSSSSVTIQPGGTARIDVNVKRAPGYTKGVTLDVYLRHLSSVYGNPFPPGITLDEAASKTLLGENESKGHIVLKAAPDAKPVKDLPFAILGAVSINFVVKVSYAGPPVLLTVSPAKQP